MLSLLVLSLQVLGLLAVALAMDRHAPQAWGGLPSAALWRRRGAGVTLLVASFGCATAQAGAATGTVLWIGMLSPAALAVVALLGWGAKRGGG